jgi:hypothetical protein
MTNRLNQALELMSMKDPHTKNDEARAKILELVGEINKVYRAHMLRSTGKTCDICGKGDNDAKHRVQDVVSGYMHRETQSPCLCFNHACGWNLSYCSFTNKRKAMLMGVGTQSLEDRVSVRMTHIDDAVSDEEVDLHFAQYVAKQLTNLARKEIK